MRTTRKKIARMQEIYNLRDWKVGVKRSEANNTDACAQLKSRPRYKSARIIVYPRVIKQARRDYPDECQRAALHHEFCEIVLSEAQDIAPEKLHNEPWFVAYQDACAERFARIIMGLTDE